MNSKGIIKLFMNVVTTRGTVIAEKLMDTRRFRNLQDRRVTIKRWANNNEEIWPNCFYQIEITRQWKEINFSGKKSLVAL